MVFDLSFHHSPTAHRGTRDGGLGFIVRKVIAILGALMKFVLQPDRIYMARNGPAPLNMDEPFSTITEIANPVLFDERGVVVLRLSSASILHFKSGHKHLQTVPALLPNDFPFQIFASKDAPGLLLESGKLRFYVKVMGTMLLLAYDVDAKRTGTMRRGR